MRCMRGSICCVRSLVPGSLDAASLDAMAGRILTALVLLGPMLLALPTPTERRRSFVPVRALLLGQFTTWSVRLATHDDLLGGREAQFNHGRAV